MPEETMNRRQLYWYLLVITFASILVSCNYNSGVETTNGCTVSASATDVTGTAPRNAQIYIISDSYLPYIDSGFALGTTADFSGNFECAIPQGTFFLYVNDESSGKTVRIEASSHFAFTSRKLGEPGSISGTIQSEGRVFLVCLAGTPHYRLLTGKSDFRFDMIPAGDYRLIVYELDISDSDKRTMQYEEILSLATGEKVALPEIRISK